jgi:hypothetical protein
MPFYLKKLRFFPSPLTLKKTKFKVVLIMTIGFRMVGQTD